MILLVATVFAFASITFGCTKPSCDNNICVAYGDPHFSLYDGEQVHFQGTCRYLMSGTCEHRRMKYPFQVYTEHESISNTASSHVKAVEIHFQKWIIRFEKNGAICITDPNGGRTFYLSFGSIKYIPSATILHVSANHMVFETSFGLRVEYSSNHLVIITVPDIYFKQLCGICGNFNGISDDRVTKEGKDVIMYDKQTGDNMIGDSWWDKPGPKSKLPERCSKEDLSTTLKEVDPKCGWKKCEHYLGIFKDYGYIYSNCFDMEAIKCFMESCAYDFELLKEEKYFHCDTIEAIIRLTERLCGITIKEWRKTFDCPCTDRSFEDPCLCQK